MMYKTVFNKIDLKILFDTLFLNICSEYMCNFSFVLSTVYVYIDIYYCLL